MSRRTLLDAGTEVSVVLGGRTRRGVVQPYDQRWSHGAFPVRLDGNGQWRLLTADEVAVVALRVGARAVG